MRIRYAKKEGGGVVSFQAVEFVLAQKIKSSPQKLLLVAIAHHVDRKTGKWTMRQADLGKDATMSVRQVKEHAAALEEDRRIVRGIQRAEDGSPEGTEYTLVGYKEWIEGAKESAIPAFEAAAALLPKKENKPGHQSAETRTYADVRKPAPSLDPNPHLGPTETRTYKEVQSFNSPLQSDCAKQDLRDGRKISFDEFWKAYPNKKGKADAKKLWSKLSTEDRQAALDGVTLYKKTEKAKSGYIREGDRYLRTRVWEDFENAEATDGTKPDDHETRLMVAKSYFDSGYWSNGCSALWRLPNELLAWAKDHAPQIVPLAAAA